MMITAANGVTTATSTPWFDHHNDGYGQRLVSSTAQHKAAASTNNRYHAQPVIASANTTQGALIRTLPKHALYQQQCGDRRRVPTNTMFASQRRLCELATSPALSHCALHTPSSMERFNNGGYCTLSSAIGHQPQYEEIGATILNYNNVHHPHAFAPHVAASSCPHHAPSAHYDMTPPSHYAANSVCCPHAAAYDAHVMPSSHQNLERADSDTLFEDLSASLAAQQQQQQRRPPPASRPPPPPPPSNGIASSRSSAFTATSTNRPQPPRPSRQSNSGSSSAYTDELGSDGSANVELEQLAAVGIALPGSLVGSSSECIGGNGPAERCTQMAAVAACSELVHGRESGYGTASKVRTALANAQNWHSPPQPLVAAAAQTAALQSTRLAMSHPRSPPHSSASSAISTSQQASPPSSSSGASSTSGIGRAAPSRLIKAKSGDAAASAHNMTYV